MSALSAPGVNESEVAVARAAVEGYGAGAPAYLRRCAGAADAEGMPGARDGFLRFAVLAEKMLAAQIP